MVELWDTKETLAIKLERAETILDRFSSLFHEMESETKKPIDPRIDKLWLQLTDYFQGLYEDIPEDDKTPMCPTCGRNPATKLHSCPYQIEINNNNDPYCTCCEDCENECKADI